MTTDVKIARHVFQVVQKERLTPHYIRIHLRGDGAQDFAPCTLGVNNKIFIPQDSASEVIFPTSGIASDDLKPIVRTYTHRAIDLAKNQITIDFVDHGESSPASAWARNAKEGDSLGVAMKLVSKPLYPQADWYFLIGDATALPVLSCILESLPLDAKGHCIIEVASAADILPAVQHPGFTVQWIYNSHPELGSTLAEEAMKVQIPAEANRFAYVASEYSSVKQLRHYFREKLGWSNKELYAFSYWKAGEAEDASVKSRQEEKSGT